MRTLLADRKQDVQGAQDSLAQVCLFFFFLLPIPFLPSPPSIPFLSFPASHRLKCVYMLDYVYVFYHLYVFKAETKCDVAYEHLIDVL